MFFGWLLLGAWEKPQEFMEQYQRNRSIQGQASKRGTNKTCQCGWSIITKNVGRGFPVLHVLPGSTVFWLNQLKFEDCPLVIQRSYGNHNF